MINRVLSGPLFSAWLMLVADCAMAAPPDPEFSLLGQNQAGLVFSSDGQTAWWTHWDGVWGGDATSPRTIVVSRKVDGAWTEPKPMPFSGTHPDDDPWPSPDGEWLYFVSERPSTEDGDPVKGDIWRFSLNGPSQLERLAINSEAAEYSPVIVTSGALYFASAREGGTGRGDLYRAPPEGDGFGSPELLSTSLNSATGEWNLWVSADESEMLFEASSRPTNVSIPGDLYYSQRQAGPWSPAVPVSALNTEGSDLLPRLHPDGLTLYYTSAPLGGHAEIRSVDWLDLRASLVTESP